MTMEGKKKRVTLDFFADILQKPRPGTVEFGLCPKSRIPESCVCSEIRYKRTLLHSNYSETQSIV